MLQTIQQSDAKVIMDNYINALRSMGYVRHSVTKSYMMWLFIMRFVNRVYDYLTDNDYNQINDVLDCIFSNRTWLVSRDTFRPTTPTETPVYVATFSLRKTQYDLLRKSESGELRATETI